MNPIQQTVFSVRFAHDADHHAIALIASTEQLRHQNAVQTDGKDNCHQQFFQAITYHKQHVISPVVVESHHGLVGVAWIQQGASPAGVPDHNNCAQVHVSILDTEHTLHIAALLLQAIDRQLVDKRIGFAWCQTASSAVAKVLTEFAYESIQEPNQKTLHFKFPS